MLPSQKLFYAQDGELSKQLLPRTFYVLLRTTLSSVK